MPTYTASNLRLLDKRIDMKNVLSVSNDVKDMREATSQDGYDGLMTSIKTRIQPSSIICFVGTVHTQDPFIYSAKRSYPPDFIFCRKKY